MSNQNPFKAYETKTNIWVPAIVAFVFTIAFHASVQILAESLMKF